jgi:hypothetical protein
MSTFRRFLAATLVVSITGMGLPLPVQAGMLPTDSALKGASTARERIATFLERRDVQAQLQTYGVDPADVQARVARLSDDEAAQLAGRIGDLPAGADAAGAIVGALLIVFIVLLITDILGLTHVFPFTKPIK